MAVAKSKKTLTRNSRHTCTCAAHQCRCDANFLLSAAKTCSIRTFRVEPLSLPHKTKSLSTDFAIIIHFRPRLSQNQKTFNASTCLNTCLPWRSTGVAVPGTKSRLKRNYIWSALPGHKMSAMQWILVNGSTSTEIMSAEGSMWRHLFDRILSCIGHFEY